MRNRDFAICALAIVIGALAIAGLYVYFGGGSSSRQYQTITQTRLATTQGSGFTILSASLNSNGYLTITVENTGSVNLDGLQFPTTNPPSGSAYESGQWSPDPTSTYPIYPGETVSGTFQLGSQYRPGLQVVVGVLGQFDISQGETQYIQATFTTTVGS